MRITLIVLTLTLTGCTANTSPDQFHLSGGFGESDGSSSVSQTGTSSYRKPMGAMASSDSEFWFIMLGLTWDLPQPKAKPTHSEHGHPLP